MSEGIFRAFKVCQINTRKEHAIIRMKMVVYSKYKNKHVSLDGNNKANPVIFQKYSIGRFQTINKTE